MGRSRRKSRVADAESTTEVIAAKDCSPIPVANDQHEKWLRELVAKTKCSDLVVHLGSKSDDDDEDPIASYDSTSGTWWAGRYIGEIQYQGLTLQIEPRFGMPSLMRWLTTITGAKLVSQGGTFQRRRVWLWLVIAHLWSVRFGAAAKHGLPYRRVSSIHQGRSLRGRLMPRQTGLMRAAGDDRLVSLSRTRVVDPVIGPILLDAFAKLNVAVGPVTKANRWLSDRAASLVGDLRALCPQSRSQRFDTSENVRYSPITEGYRPLVDLSLSILKRQPNLPTPDGKGKAIGVLLDMAEIWETYLAKVLQVAIPELRVVHTGRAREHYQSLLFSSDEGELGSLRPDIMIFDHLGRRLGLVDAKYKSTRAGRDRRSGVLTSDLYQLTAYLCGFGAGAAPLDAFLVYPSDTEGQIESRLQQGNPWQLPLPVHRNLWFLSLACETESNAATLSASELQMIRTLRSVLALDSQLSLVS